MLTVVILSAGAKRIFNGARMYFEPFVDSGQLCFVEWNQSPSAHSLAETLPGLREAIRGRGDWRAIVVESAPESCEPSERTVRDNPFDYLDNVGDAGPARSRLLLNLEESKHPIVRLSHALLGYPAMGAKDFERVLQFEQVDDATGTVLSVEETESELAERGTTLHAELAAARKDATRFDAQVQLRAVPYSAEERAEHARLADRYRMRDIRPTEVLFVATRPPVEANATAELIDAWRTDGEHDSSRFVERNDYPPSSRFAVYDLPHTGHSSYEEDVLSFWLGVLSLAVNQVPPSALQADRVYRLDIELSAAQLGSTLNGHMSRLNAIREHLSQLLRQPDRPPESTVADLVKPQRVHVEFDRLGGDELAVGTTGYGLASDVPRAELPRWQQEIGGLRGLADTFMRKPKRLLLRSVWEARAKAQAYLTQDLELSALQREEIEEDLSVRMSRLVAPATADVLDRERLRRLIAEHDEQVAKEMRQRLRRVAILAVVGLATVVWLLGLAPYLLLAGAKSGGVLAGAALVTVVVLAIVVVGILGALVLLRLRLLRLIRAFNTALRSFSTRVTAGAVLFAEYLSDLATYRYGRALLISASDRQSRDAGRVRGFLDLGERITAQIESEKQLVSSLGQPLAIQRVHAGVADFDPAVEHDVRALFRLPVGEGRATFNQSGEKVAAPYDFVTGVSLERIRLIERDARAEVGSDALQTGVRA